MKRIIVMLCTLVMVCCAAAACAEVPVSNICKPNAPVALKTLVGGKSFDAMITGWETTGEDEDGKLTISVTICERDRFDPAVIDNLAERDIIRFGDRTVIMAMEVTRSDLGVIVKDGDGEGYSFFKDEDGNYIATTDTDYPFWTEVFSFKVPVEKDISFLDWSNPENLKEPVKLGYDEFLDHLLEEKRRFTANNTRLTFDENGKLVEILLNYSPWD